MGSLSKAAAADLETDGKLLKRLDIAAHQELFEDQVFQDFFLPQQAKLLTQKTIVALLPLFRPIMSPGDNSTNAPIVSENDEYRLHDSFDRALRLRWQMLLCEDRFEYSFPTHGSSFCAVSMIDAQNLVVPGKAPTQGKRAAVSMTLVPGLLRKVSHGQLVDYERLPCVGGDPARGSVPFRAANVILRHAL